MARDIHLPKLDLLPPDQIVPVEHGGTGCDNAASARNVLQAVPSSLLGASNGIAKLNQHGKIPSEYLDIDLTGNNDPTITGPISVPASSTNNYQITNYDSRTNYVLVALGGSISRNGDTITWVAPTSAGVSGFSVNNKTYQITVTQPVINKPSIISPANGSTNHGSQITFISSNFSVNGATDTHASSSWQLATDAQFSNIVASAINSTTAKTSWTVTNLSPNTQYFARVQHTGATYGTSAWSDAITVTTKANFIPQTEQAKLLAPDGAALDYFGYSVAISSGGDIAIIGAPYDDDKGSESGSAYIFINDGNNWSPQFKLTAPDGAANDKFGISTDISSDGNTVIVGAYGDDGNRGSAYIFVRDINIWTLNYKVTASDGATNDYFGSSVAINADGSIAIVGAYGDDSNRGSAYVFTRSGNIWTETKIIASDGVGNDYFGSAVDINPSATTAIIGAYGDDSSRGSAYIFVRNGNIWSQETKLTTSSGANGDQFGRSVAISSDGNIALIGAPYDDDRGTDSGSVYVFARTANIWSQQTQLLATDGAPNDYFGYSVAISGDGKNAIIGAYGDENSRGSAYIFTSNNNVWTIQYKLLASDGAVNDQFGRSVAINIVGNIAIVGAHLDDDRGTDSGSAYIYG